MRTLTEAEQNRLIIDHMDLIPPVAAEFRNGEIDFEELCAAGREGLVKAARAYTDRGYRFSTYAIGVIRNEIFNFTRTKASEWYPKEDSNPLDPLDGDKIERIYEWDGWGERGNAEAICERWSALNTSPEQLLLMYDDLKDKSHRFTAAFMSLNHIERQLVKLCYLETPTLSIPDAARQIGISYWRAARGLRRALWRMKQIISRIEHNERKPALEPA